MRKCLSPISTLEAAFLLALKNIKFSEDKFLKIRCLGNAGSISRLSGLREPSNESIYCAGHILAVSASVC